MRRPSGAAALRHVYRSAAVMVCRSCAASFCSLESTGACACCPMHHLYNGRERRRLGAALRCRGHMMRAFTQPMARDSSAPHAPKALNRTNSVQAESSQSHQFSPCVLVALCSSEAQPSRCLLNVLPHTITCTQHHGQVKLGSRAPLLRCQAPQPHSLGTVRLNALAPVKQVRKV